MVDQLALLSVGLLAGMVGGLLGIGGGIVLMPVLRFGIGLSPAYAAGTCVLAVFFTTLGGGFKHYRLNHVPIRSLIPVIVAGAFSTIIFSMFFLYLARKSQWLDFGIGIVFILLSVGMVLDGIQGRKTGKLYEERTSGIQNSLTRKVMLGGFAGVFPGLLGIGTGVILVPGFIYMLNAATKVAIGSSLVCFAVNAFISALLKSMQDYVDFAVSIPICIGTLAGSQIGAIINQRIPSANLRILFSLVFSVVSIRFILSAFEAVK